jgi:hypothetical protein
MVIAVIFYSTYYALMYAINALLLVIVSLGSSIYYVVIAVRVIKWLKQSPLRNERPVKKVLYQFINISTTKQNVSGIKLKLIS